MWREWGLQKRGHGGFGQLAEGSGWSPKEIKGGKGKISSFLSQNAEELPDLVSNENL